MDFRLSDDQVALADGIRAMVAGRLGLEHLRAGEGAEVAISPGDWQLLADTGVFALTLPEPAGLGLGLADAAVVFEELGRALVPGPLVGTALAASAQLVDGAAEGTVPVGDPGRAPGRGGRAAGGVRSGERLDAAPDRPGAGAGGGPTDRRPARPAHPDVAPVRAAGR
jgi:hypothetical protein